ncbi:TIGR03773 family transporter-associated surface protein, partial [uncultured Rothia sp.]|uniref:TIGR03773 family transporter-associated surface protein n=1 Tax=uncultured Rothia sp. TaxID=316088 RepID=UPI002630A815
LAVVNTAEHSGREEVTHGHFDVGPILNGGTLTSSVKDDRTSPARHVSPGALEFVLNDAAKLNLPAGMEDIAPAGTPVHMIGATQQQGVPWLGWSTQDPELLKQLDGPVTMSLNGFEGPGTMSTFLSGNFGSAGQKVFDSRSGGSFQVPANTHQHSNWVFTAEGRYTVTIGWTARLKNGQQVSSESVLHFTVGNPDNAPAGNNAQGAAEAKQDGGNNANGANSTNGGEKSTAKNPVNGSVDEATGIVTKPDGSKVRIVGKTASGEDCALTSQELANAQKAAAAGKLPNTGVVIDPFMVSTSILALALGAMILRSARRKGRSGDTA